MPKVFSDLINSMDYGSDPLHFAGMVLTGFAASAGSGYWHDQLSKLRGVKQAALKVKEELAQ